jgi:hypothetical protein
MSIPKGPLGIDPLQFSVALFGVLLFFVLYLLLPRALRKQYFGAYPRRHAWSARSRMRRSRGGYGQVRRLIREKDSRVRWTSCTGQARTWSLDRLVSGQLGCISSGFSRFPSVLIVSYSLWKADPSLELRQ